ncbi:hypothetical protein MBO12_04555 [Candidatus Saccharibacteria bacterium]|nr:hypothetical protein [Candidatus Saccharibacteria bacterium]
MPEWRAPEQARSALRRRSAPQARSEPRWGTPTERCWAQRKEPRWVPRKEPRSAQQKARQRARRWAQRSATDPPEQASAHR